MFINVYKGAALKDFLVFFRDIYIFNDMIIQMYDRVHDFMDDFMNV